LINVATFDVSGMWAYVTLVRCRETPKEA